MNRLNEGRTPRWVRSPSAGDQPNLRPRMIFDTFGRLDSRRLQAAGCLRAAAASPFTCNSKRTATLWSDKVAVLDAWSRKGRSLPYDGANDKPPCVIFREFTVIPPKWLRSAARNGLRRSVPYNDRSEHHQSAQRDGDSQGRSLNDSMAVRSQARPTPSAQILVVVMDVSPGPFRL